MPLFIVSCFFANCRKPRSLAGAVAGLVHDVQLICKTGIRKVHLSTPGCELLFWIAVKIPKCSHIHSTTTWSSTSLWHVLSSGAINNTWWNITQKKYCQFYYFTVTITSLLTRIKNLHCKRLTSFIKTSTQAYAVWNWLLSFCNQ